MAKLTQGIHQAHLELNFSYFLIEDSPNILQSGVEEVQMVQTVLVAVGGLDLVHGDAQDDADQVGDSGQEGRPLQIGREMMVRTISWGLIVVKQFCRNKKSFSSQKEGFI